MIPMKDIENFLKNMFLNKAANIKQIGNNIL